jgi:hypothetical protein
MISMIMIIRAASPCTDFRLISRIISIMVMMIIGGGERNP